jgi:hypothetical protein
VPELPPPLPPELRTVGQLVAESIRGYGNRFWFCLPLGVPLAVADQLIVHHHKAAEQALVFWALTPLFVAAYVWACRIVLDARPTRTAVAVALLVWLPFPALRASFILPGLAWFAFIGLAVPVAMVEGSRFRESLVRGRRLALADYAHALGSLCALVIVVGVAEVALEHLLRSQSDTGLRAALALSDVVLSPLLYVGSALLYLDQTARLISRRDADLHPALDPDPAGRPDAQVES